ncbi:uncharacterized protein FFB20_11344 [Fusarium fujikuroi]|uniref:Putative gamma-glutamylcyclotransferase n=1 Tax=Gibberella fujikuroi (strain CBS 195.34 / IMI 58289 / NRRL A-6831) TaxID=1279085 RepID=S0DXL5_GIBF5|nr:uncharacterized protein FFUJ_02147 [Fusarium fujikuroi IMI 58289]CCT65218.1 uncharacterized protein FFUJ_02147 [Fusarium fujikuroi IMI 58289]SCO01075.1 uncharacterized protein FFB20_11344 [Fusarium fujikuroi]SCO23767.1 uncharacterized protein FFM5_13450 [Fusarium fujikuroi]SCO35236.1 uncharacterized protein FFMR_03810 [Fusarium fujikuroi]
MAQTLQPLPIKPRLFRPTSGYDKTSNLHFTNHCTNTRSRRLSLNSHGPPRRTRSHGAGRISISGRQHPSINYHSVAKAVWILTQSQEMPMKEKRRLRAANFLIKLEAPLNSVQAVVQAAGLWCPSSSEVLAAADLSGQSCSFFKINGMDKLAIEGWLKEYPHLDFQPTIIKNPYAQKDLSPTSLYPTLGLDITLPRFRPGPAATPRPLQNECPVWYFFYGTLTDPSFLSKLFGSNFQAEYHAATIRGGVLKTWGRYYALVDDPSHTIFVPGKALLVETREQEERLRAYETNSYEVVRCCIEMGLEKPMSGLTFRFVTDIMD